jgi:hypothetical protein
MEVIRDVMLSAAECADLLAQFSLRKVWSTAQVPNDGGWMTLRELSDLTNYGEASISAQLRHLRKPHFGGYLVVKRRRGLVAGGTWEYRISGHCECAQLAWLFAGGQM